MQVKQHELGSSVAVWNREQTPRDTAIDITDSGENQNVTQHGRKVEAVLHAGWAFVRGMTQGWVWGFGVEAG